MRDLDSDVSRPWEGVDSADRLVGRAAELDRWGGCMARLDAGGGGAVALVGEPGIGKTRLMAALTASARKAGIRVLEERGCVKADLLERVGRPVLTEPVLVTVDDLHSREQTDLSALESLLQLATADRVLLVLGYRERQLAPRLAAALARAASTRQLRLWRLGPLSLADAEGLFDSGPEAARIHREGSGNPFYMLALAGGGVDAYTAAGTALLGELAGLTDRELHVASTASVLAEPFDPELLAVVAELSTPAALEAVDGLTRVDLVRTALPAPLLAFRHPVVGRIIYSRLEPGRRLAAHLRAEAELTRRGAPLPMRAHHVARAAHASRPEHAATLLDAAAETIHAAPAEAAGWLAAALRLIRPDDERRLSAQVLYAQARMLSGHPSDSRDLLHSVLPRAGESTAAEFASTVAYAGRSERLLGRYIEAAALVRQGLSAQSGLDSRVVVALLTELADVALDRLDHQAAREHAGEAVRCARKCQDRLGEAGALAQVAKAHVMAGNLAAAQAATVASADLVDAAPDAEVITNLPCLYLLGMTEAALDQLVDAHRHLARAADLSRRTGQAFILPAVLKTLGECELRLGRLPRARNTFDEAQRLAAEDGGPATRAIVASLRAITLMWLRGVDDFDQALSLAEWATGIADGLAWGWTAFVRCTYAEVLMHCGETGRCQRLMLEAVGGDDMPRVPTGRRPRYYEVLAQSAIAEGNLAAATHWSERAMSIVDAGAGVSAQGYAHRLRMRVLAATGDLDAAAASATAAWTSFMDRGFALEAGRAGTAFAILLLDQGQSDAAGMWLDRAELTARHCRSARLTGDVAWQRRRLEAGRRPPGARPVGLAHGGLAALTEREREIAILTSTGMTSVGIARELTLSVRTVDTHLGRIYRKLGLSNRAGLTRAMVGIVPEPDPLPTRAELVFT